MFAEALCGMAGKVAQKAAFTAGMWTFFPSSLSDAWNADARAGALQPVGPEVTLRMEAMCWENGTERWVELGPWMSLAILWLSASRHPLKEDFLNNNIPLFHLGNNCWVFWSILTNLIPPIYLTTQQLRSSETALEMLTHAHRGTKMFSVAWTSKDKQTDKWQPVSSLWWHIYECKEVGKGLEGSTAN